MSHFVFTFSYEKVLVSCEKSLLEFLSNLVLKPPESEKIIFTKVFMSDKNCQNTSTFCDFEKNFMKKSKIPILIYDSSHKSLVIILITFFD